MGFKLFSFDWFFSKERKEMQALEIEGKKLENERLKTYLEEKKQQVQTSEKPFKKLIFTNGSITAVFKNGIVITKKGCDDVLFSKVKNATTEAEIELLLIPTPELPKIKEIEVTEEQKWAVSSASHILQKNTDFVFENGDIFLKNVKLALPPVVLASFIELMEKMSGYQKIANEQKSPYSEVDGYTDLEEIYEALKMFWRWTALNPIESSRNDLLAFVKKNDITITSNGLLELYRRVVSVGEANKELSKFVSEQYYKVKKAKKGPRNYNVVKDNDGPYVLRKEEVGVILGWQTMVGNLADLYLDLPNMQENIYTDGHTHTKVIKVGEVYKEDEDKIDLDNTRECSNGLHVGSRAFGFSGFGDTGVIALVNPMKVRSVPVYDSTKMRVSEMFIAGVVDLKEYENSVDTTQINDYSQEYFGITVEELEETLANQTYEDLACQDRVPAVAIKDIIDIKNVLKERLVKI